MEFFRNNLVKPFDTEVRKPKVVSIPVHFASSNTTRSAAARRIQKVLRGFLVRKNMKKIVAVKKEVGEIEMKFLHRETVDLIRKDAKERLKMNEMLMALLFRLDSISGVNNLGVRDCRKSLIKKVIMLQERLDAIVSGNDAQVEGKQSLGEEDLQGVGQTDGHRDDEADKVSIQDSGLHDDCISAGEKEAEGTIDEVEGDSIASDNFGNPESCAGKEIDTMDTEEGAEEMEVRVEAVTAAAAGEETVEIEKSKSSEGTMEVEKTDLYHGNNENAVEEEGKVDEAYGDSIEVTVAAAGAGEETVDENKVLMEKMIEKNEMLIKIVTDLCEKNKLQTEMLNALSKRVNSLEKKQQNKSKKRRPVSKNCFDD